MPAPTDHALRRAQLVALAAELVAEVGLPALTVRALAARAGYTTGIVTHYFASKQDLLLALYESQSEAANARFAASLAAGEDVATTLAHFLPLDPATRQSWRVNFAYWGLALNDETYATRQRHWMEVSRGLIGQLLAREGRADCAADADRLLAALMGYAIRTAFDPTPTREVAMAWLAREVG